MKAKSRFSFVALVIALLLLLTVYPAVAEDVYKTQYQYIEVPIYWGNGIDDNGDGVIDDLNETDVTAGNQTINGSMNTIYTWNPAIDVSRGLYVGAYQETPCEISASFNASSAPTDNCTYSNILPMFPDPGYLTENNVLNILTFFVKLKPTSIMTGTSEFWYRSPLVWDDTKFSGYFLNIYDDTGALIFASGEMDGGSPGTYCAGVPFALADNSTITAGANYERLYTKIHIPLRSEVKYRFEEYVSVIGSLPQNSVKLFISFKQDIGGDGETDTYIFVDKQNARKIQAEASWGMVCLVGLGRAGSEHLCFGNNAGYFPYILSSSQEGSHKAAIRNVKSVKVVIPLRMTMKSDVTVYLYVYSDGSYYSTHVHLKNVTGTIIWDTNISDPDITHHNHYGLSLSFEDYGTGADDEAFTFTVYDQPNCQVFVRNNSNDPMVPWESIQGVGMFYEVQECDAYLPSHYPDQSAQVQFLVGLVKLLAGIIITGIVILLTYFVHIPIRVAATIGLGAFELMISGVDMMLSATGGVPGTVYDLLTGGNGRALQDIIEGIKFIAGGLFLILGKVLEAIKFLGNALQVYGATILEAFVEIVWFIIFLMAMAGWALFLSLMRAVLHGDFEGAWRIAKKAIKSDWAMAKKAERFAEKQTIGRYKKTRRWQREGVRFRRNQERQDRRTEAYVAGQDEQTYNKYYGNRSRFIENDNAGQGSGRME